MNRFVVTAMVGIILLLFATHGAVGAQLPDIWPRGRRFRRRRLQHDHRVANGANESVEFTFTMTALRCYVRYNCTGRQLIDSGAVLINGERSTLDLLKAENQ